MIADDFTPLDKARFWAKVEKTATCWNWLGATSDKRGGYGRVWRPRSRRHAYAHRVAYELEVGPIPDGLVIDHLCRNRTCVNPAHMEPVTFQENINRGIASPIKTHCIRGHEFTPENTRQTPSKRTCRACVAEASRRHRRRMGKVS